jgi:hypothetical protein
MRATTGTFVHERHGREGSVFVQGLGTCIWSLSYDARTRTGTIEMPEGYCTDMSGAVTVFTRIDPAVVQVITKAGGVVDTTYQRVKDNTWTAIANRPPHGVMVEVPNDAGLV